MHRKQIGHLLTPRTVVLVVILLVILMIPVWMKKAQKNSSKPQRPNSKASAVAMVKPENPPATPVVAAAPAVADTIGHGLTYAALPQTHQDAVALTCQGEPAPQDLPVQGACNPAKGDTSCRTVLPVLCIKPGALPAPEGLAPEAAKDWSGAMLSATKPVMGALLSSAAVASARCQAELGDGWRMAELHDQHGADALLGQRGIGFFPHTRYWVHTNNQAGNCWNSAP